MFDNLLAIDQAANNSSVTTIEWRGYRLLFPGDAEHRSWKEMDKRSLLEADPLLEGRSPRQLERDAPATSSRRSSTAPPDGKQRYAGVSTCEGT